MKTLTRLLILLALPQYLRKRCRKNPVHKAKRHPPVKTHRNKREHASPVDVRGGGGGVEEDTRGDNADGAAKNRNSRVGKSG